MANYLVELVLILLSTLGFCLYLLWPKASKGARVPAAPAAPATATTPILTPSTVVATEPPDFQIKQVSGLRAKVFCDLSGSQSLVAAIASALSLKEALTSQSERRWIRQTKCEARDSIPIELLEDHLISYSLEFLNRNFEAPFQFLRDKGVKVFFRQESLHLMNDHDVGVLFDGGKPQVYFRKAEWHQVTLDQESHLIRWKPNDMNFPETLPLKVARNKACDYSVIICYRREERSYAIQYPQLLRDFKGTTPSDSLLCQSLFEALETATKGFFSVSGVESFEPSLPSGVKLRWKLNEWGDEIDSVQVVFRIPDDCIGKCDAEILCSDLEKDFQLVLYSLLQEDSPVFLNMTINKSFPHRVTLLAPTVNSLIVDALLTLPIISDWTPLSTVFCSLKHRTLSAEQGKHVGILTWSDLQVLCASHDLLRLERKTGKGGKEVVMVGFSSGIVALGNIVAFIEQRVQQMSQKAEEMHEEKKQELASKSVPLVEPARVSEIEISSLSATSQEYAHVLGLVQLSPQQVVRIKRTNYRSRKQGFDSALQLLKTVPVRAYHGTPSAENGRSIARDGPNFSLCGKTNGSALGAGFYCSEHPQTAHGYAGGVGTVCVIQVIPGVVMQGGNGSLNPTSLRAQGYHSIQSNQVRVLSMPDQVIVDYLVDLAGSRDSFDDVSADSIPLKTTQEWLQWQLLESIRKAEVSKLEQDIAAGEVFRLQFSHDQESLREVKRQLSVHGSDLQSMIFRLSTVWKNSGAEWKERHVLNAPIYTKKQVILDCIFDPNVQGSFIQAPTGSGKTVCIPLWILDKFERQNHSNGAPCVVVLVPTPDIAQQQAKFVASLRDWTLGREIGYATPEQPVWNTTCAAHGNLLSGNGESIKSSLVFMTYEHFSDLLHRKHTQLSEWAAIICDEIHDRQTAVDTLLTTLFAGLRDVTPSLRVVFLSATLNKKGLREYYEEKTNRKSAFLDLSEEISDPFPVEVEYCPIVSDNTGGRKKAHEILFEAVSPLLESHFKQTLVEKNVIIFVSSVKVAQHLVSKLSASKFAKQANTFLLYPNTSAEERFQIFSLNRTIASIVVATNFAESGLTLQGVSLILDSGRKTLRIFDPRLQIFEERELWISRASAEQRRGRAGRLCPGKCIRLYTESDLRDEMPDFDSPGIHDDDISSLVLRHYLLRNGFDAQEFRKSLPDPPSAEHVSSTFEHLKQIGLGKERWKPDEANQIPLGVRWAVALLFAVRNQCPASVAKIACLSDYTNFEVADDLEGFSPAKLSDHEVYLNVYEKWEQNPSLAFPKSVTPLITWFPLVRQRVKHVQDSLEKMEKRATNSVPSEGLSAAIRRSLLQGFWTFRGHLTADQTAVLPVEGAYAGLSFRVRKSSLRFQRLPGSPVSFTSATREKNPRTIKVAGAFVVESGWMVEQATVPQLARRGVKTDEMIKTTHSLPTEIDDPMFERFVVPQVHNSFFNTLVAKEEGGQFSICCPRSTQEQVKSFIESVFEDLQFGDISLDGISLHGVPSTELAERLRLVAVGLYPFLSTIRLKIDVSRSRVRCSKMFLALFTQYLKSLGSVAPPSPQQAPVRAPEARGKLLSNPRFAILENAFLASEAILHLADFESEGPGRTLLAISHFITHHTALFIYGGFIRDYIVRGETHSEMDLDVGYDEEFGKGTAGSSGVSRAAAISEWNRVLTWGQRYGVTVLAQNGKGPNVTEYKMRGPNSEKVTVELVDVARFRREYGAPDADVNALKILPTPTPKGASPSAPYIGAELAFKFPASHMPAACGSLSEIVARIQARKLKVLNPVTFNVERRRKFESARGWEIVT